MQHTEGARWMLRIARAELDFCHAANGMCRLPGVAPFFALVSRLGDGAFWYGVMLALPLLFGPAGAVTSLRMALVAVTGVIIYRLIKQATARARPCVASARIMLRAPALDRYSFPSGHTLHAVSFTLVATSQHAALAPILVPFALMVGASRVLLGLHYPTDVIVGAIIGAGLGTLALAI